MTSPTYGDPTQLSDLDLREAMIHLRARIAEADTMKELDIALADFAVLRSEKERRDRGGLPYPTMHEKSLVTEHRGSKRVDALTVAGDEEPCEYCGGTGYDECGECAAGRHPDQDGLHKVAYLLRPYRCHGIKVTCIECKGTGIQESTNPVYQATQRGES